MLLVPYDGHARHENTFLSEKRNHKWVKLKS